MIKVWLIITATGITAVIGMGGIGCSSKPASNDAAVSYEEAITVIGVEQLMERPEGFPQRIRVKGLVGRVLPEQNLFSLVDLSDREEFLKTGNTHCVTLPVRWSGPMPAVQDEVVAEGMIIKVEGKLIFDSGKIEKVANDPQK